MEEIETHLDLRSLKVTRRAGDAKPARPAPLSAIQPFSSLRRVEGSAILAQPSVSPVDPQAMKVAEEIVKDISSKGRDALFAHCVRLGDIEVISGLPLHG